MNKKGDLSLNVIVMATVAVIVLVVLIYIFLNGANVGRDGILSCESKGGSCVVATDDKKCPDAGQTYASWTCKDKDKICCTNNDELFGISTGE